MTLRVPERQSMKFLIKAQKKGNTIITDQLLIANKFNLFFTNIGSNLS